MRRFALLLAGVVATVVEQEDAPQIEGHWVECGVAGPGWSFDGVTFAPPPAVQHPASRRLTKLEFQELLGDETYKAIKRLAKVHEDVSLWLDKFQMLTADPDGTSISKDDPRTRAGLMALSTVPELQALGLTAQFVDAMLA